MKKLLIAFCLLPLAVMGQEIKFDTQDYKSVGVYDRWEHSPFRTGELAGNCAVVDNPDLTNNPNTKVLAFQRSRLASNIFGARIDLKKPIALGPAGKVVHVLINRPMEGRVMLVGLGKRRDRAGQSQEVEQFWIKSTTPVPAGQWADAVFPIKSAEGVDIYSLVVVPHAESPHEMKQDAVVYIDDINIHLTNAPRITLLKTEGAAKKKSHSDFVSVTEANRNGMVTAADGTTLNNHKVAYGKAFKVKMVPAPGFTYGDFTITHGDKVESLKKTDIAKDGTFTIPAKWMDGNVTIECIFISTSK